eukprot:230414-Rhodomonas_salina.1
MLPSGPSSQVSLSRYPGNIVSEISTGHGIARKYTATPTKFLVQTAQRLCLFACISQRRGIATWLAVSSEEREPLIPCPVPEHTSSSSVCSARQKCQRCGPPSAGKAARSTSRLYATDIAVWM